MPQSIYQKHPLSRDALMTIGEKWWFIGLDLAPNESLETGLVVLDRNRQVYRHEKLLTDTDILKSLQSLGPPQNLLVVMDVPKHPHAANKWRQEAIRMHPLQLVRPESQVAGDLERLERIPVRARQLREALEAQGITVLLFYNDWAKMAYNLQVPYRSRTSAGCRALQTAIRFQLEIGNLPANLVPIAVLDAMVASYAAWSVYAGQESEHYALYRDEAGRPHVDALKRMPSPPPPQRRWRRRWR